MVEITGSLVKAEEIEDALLQFVVTKQEVDRGSISRIESQLFELSKAGKKAKNVLFLEFWGYDDDCREVFQIKEIQSYLRKVFSMFPEIFYYANIEGYTFAILANAIFTNKQEVTLADQAIKTHAKIVKDDEAIITVQYYTSHQNLFHK